MKELVCIVCPNSCTLQIEQRGDEISVSGNRCKRGESFAKDELTAPKRTISSTVKTVFPDAPVLPVRVSAEIPKSKIFEVMEKINSVTLTRRVKIGEAVITDVLGLGVDVIATDSVLTDGNDASQDNK